nr:hypothetical protein [Paracoccus aestuariivivens]
MPATAQDSLRLILPETHPVVGEMIALTIRGEYTGAITLEDMTFPDSAAYDWIQISPDEWKDERIEGKLRRTFQRHIAIFAKQSGSLAIGPVTHMLTKAETNARAQVPVTAKAVSINVAPYPAPGRPLAASTLAVTDELSGDPARIRDDQTIQRRITLTAQGSMGHLLPPRPDLREPWLISFAAPEKRETRLTQDGPVAFVQWEWSLRPITGEQGALPPMRFSWFDTGKREMRGAIMPPIPFGYGKLAENVGGMAQAPALARWSSMAAVLAGFLMPLLVLLRSRRFPALSRLKAALHRLRPNPALTDLREAARGQDLLALRRSVEKYLGHEASVSPTQNLALHRLDTALFAKEPHDFDRDAFLAEITRSRGR